MGLKLTQNDKYQIIGFSIVIICSISSGYFLWLAQKTIPIGTSYAIWTGMGATGTFIIGVLFFNESSSLGSFLGIFFIITGIILLKLAN